MSEEILTVATNAARAAGEILTVAYGNDTSEIAKNPGQIVTDADLAADKVITQTIHAAFPDHQIYSEESGLQGDDADYLWIVDPLDGTTNFSHRLGSIFAVSIAVHHKGKPIIGIVYNPLADELFAAHASHGATLNDEPLAPTTQTDLARAVIYTGRSSSSEEKKRFAGIFSQLTTTTRSQRAFSCTSLGLCFVATGRLDAHIDNGTNYYDGAAGAVVAREAGLEVTDFAGQPWNPDPQGNSDLLATNAELHAPLLEILSKQ